MDATVKRVARPSWVNARTIAGALLFLAAFVGGQRVLADSSSLTTVVRAAHDVPAGTMLSAADLEVASLKLGAEVAPLYAGSVDAASGYVLTQALVAGELVPNSALAREGPIVDSRSLTIPVTPEHAVGGALRPGDRVDVYATFDRTTGRSRTELIASNLEVQDVLRAGGAMLDEETVIGVTVSVPPEGATSLAFAIRAGQIDLARVEGLSSDEPTP